jgi:hypothetical protein
MFLRSTSVAAITLLVLLDGLLTLLFEVGILLDTVEGVVEWGVPGR